MMHAGIAAALELARERHNALAEGDLDHYSSLDDTLAQACAELVSDGTGALTETDIPSLDELIALETQSRMLLEEMMAEASARLGTLRDRGRTNNAYLRQERFSVNGA